MRTFSEQNHDRPRDPDALEDEVQTLRDDLGDLVHELDRRRRRVLDWRGQLERHRGALTVAAVVA